MSETLIRRGFESALKAWADAQNPVIPVAWENVELNPQPLGTYLRAFLLPAATFSEDLQRTHAVYRGIFQVTVCAPVGTGPAAAEAIVASLRALFAPSSTLLVSGLRVFITEPLSRGPGIPEPDRFNVPCSIPYRADTTP
jgi:hypothetical protein